MIGKACGDGYTEPIERKTVSCQENCPMLDPAQNILLIGPVCSGKSTQGYQNWCEHDFDEETRDETIRWVGW
jgi:hypothetical protein